ncbi:MAG TPA: NAD(P)/FAD-dependent oxidoreductase [Acidisoma sp.]|uniref:NAD(P)/FAD-dependent oxidoreductase n=1 Tax=Acidisoma sp. TaxID=1872115 RepID=UPI002C343BC4|nr:NAD(P)/FAD-dependent oxidoreductase [Acidisoma sp.]HTI02316.1 NAD(P)/FAD-dependent oxidoreductase [Acidisoma sp.]
MSEADLIVVGGGPAGVEAAIEAARHGLAVTLMDEAPEAGGQVYRATPRAFSGELVRKADPTGVGLRDRLRESRAITLFDHTVWSVSPGFRVDALSPEGPVSRKAPAVIAASGAQERVVPFPGWTRPEVVGLAAATIMLKSQGILPGQLTLLAGQGPLLLAVAIGILKAGGRVAAIIDLASRSEWLADWPALASRPDLALRGFLWQAKLRNAGVPILYRHAIRLVEEVAEGQVQVTVGPVAANGAALDDIDRIFQVDAVAVGNGLTASTDITRLLRATHHFEALRGGWVPTLDAEYRSSVPGLYVAGDGAGLAGAAAAACDGRLAGLVAARDLGALSQQAYETAAAPLRRSAARARRFGTAMARLMALRPAQVEAIPPETVLCRCEDVTRADITAAAAEGARTLNQLKAWTRCGMGPCQGRICGDVIGAALAAEGCSREQAGYFTGRTPFRPLPLDQLAGTVAYADLKLPPPAPV